MNFFFKAAIRIEIEKPLALDYHIYLNLHECLVPLGPDLVWYVLHGRDGLDEIDDLYMLLYMRGLYFPITT